MKILVFSAHGADFCSRAGGTIAKHVRRGDDVRIVALTYGERSESGGLFAGGAKPTIEQVRQVRIEETTRAAEILGVEFRCLGWPDLGFDFSSDTVKVLAQEIREFRADVVLTHHGPDPQSVDHDTTWRLAVRATQLGAAVGLESELAPVRRPSVFLFEATVPLTELEGFQPDLYVDITDVFDVKMEALGAFHRAQGNLAPWYVNVAKRRAFQAQRLSGRSEIEYAEAFERTTPWVGNALPVSAR